MALEKVVALGKTEGTESVSHLSPQGVAFDSLGNGHSAGLRADGNVGTGLDLLEQIALLSAKLLEVGAPVIYVDRTSQSGFEVYLARIGFAAQGRSCDDTFHVMQMIVLGITVDGGVDPAPVSVVDALAVLAGSSQLLSLKILGASFFILSSLKPVESLFAASKQYIEQGLSIGCIRLVHTGTALYRWCGMKHNGLSE